MKRDMRKISESMLGKIPTRYQMTTEEWCETAEEVAEGDINIAFKVILRVFQYGFALGMRYQKKCMKEGAT